MKLEPISLPSPAPGTERTLQVYHFSPAQPKNAAKVYIQAGLHADEWPGLLVLQHLIPMLEQLENAQALTAHFVVVPFANPVGLTQHLFGASPGRYDAASGQNFNRGLGINPRTVADLLEQPLGKDRAANTQHIREALLQTVWQLPDDLEVQSLHKTLLGLSIDADIVLDLHCDISALPHVYCCNQQEPMAQALAQFMGAQVLLSENVLGEVAFDGTHTQSWVWLQNRFDQADIELGCFSATIELRGKLDVSDAQAVSDARNLLDFLRHAQMITDTPTLTDAPPPVVASLDKIQVIRSPNTGILVYQVALGDQVKKGQVIAEIVLLDQQEANVRTPIKAETDGLVFTLSHIYLVRPGSQLGMIAPC